MLVKQEQLNPCEVELHIEVEADKVKAAIDKAYSELGKSVNIPGFRKGKAPKQILEQFLDQGRVMERAADGLMTDAYKAALEESKVEPYAIAEVEVEKYEIGEPMIFKAKVPLAPVVELGKYKDLKVERNLQKITDKDVDAEIDSIRKRHASYPEITDRAAQAGDVVRIETKAENEADEEPKSNVAKIGENLPDFDKGLTGMNVGDEKVIKVAYPKDYPTEELAGKTVPVLTKMMEIREEKLPELNDEWVKETFSGKRQEDAESEAELDAVDTVDKLKAKVKEAMLKAAEEAADTEVQNKVVHEAVEGSKVDFPRVMVEEAIDDRIEELNENLKKRKVTMEDYLKYKNTTIEDLRGEYEQESTLEIKTRLVLREIIDKEELKVEEQDIEAELNAMAESNHVPVETIKAYVEKTDGITSVINRILAKKVMDFLVQSSNIKNVGK